MTNQASMLDFASIGQDVTIWPMAKIVSPNVISIGDSVIIDDFVFFAGGTRAQVGSFVHIASFTSIAGGGEFCMEDFSGLSGGVRVYTGNEDYSGGCLTNPAVPHPYRVPSRSYVHIGKHAIVGANAVILPGVTIGEGAVVGANALITKDCEPWRVYFGSPAKAIRVRPKERILELEAVLRKDLFDATGHYVPCQQRESQLSSPITSETGVLAAIGGHHA